MRSRTIGEPTRGRRLKKGNKRCRHLHQHQHFLFLLHIPIVNHHCPTFLQLMWSMPGKKLRLESLRWIVTRGHVLLCPLKERRFRKKVELGTPWSKFGRKLIPSQIRWQVTQLMKVVRNMGAASFVHHCLHPCGIITTIFSETWMRKISRYIWFLLWVNLLLKLPNKGREKLLMTERVLVF